MNKPLYSQQGATLIVSLIILAVITILGIASIRSSSLELRMANSVRDRTLAFQTAEAGMLRIERQLREEPYTIASFLPTCAAAGGPVRTWGAACFTENCANGFCFTGSIMDAVKRDECRLVNEDGDLVQPWRQPETWSTPGRHSVVTVPLDGSGQRDQEVQYTVEFLCFVPPKSEGPSALTDQTGEYEPLYRITVRAEGEARRSVVMLQSTISVPDEE